MLESVKLLFSAFFDICKFKRRPQDIPQSTNLMSLSVFVYLLIATLLLVLTETPGHSFLSALVEIFILLLFTVGLLALSGKTGRWIQTITAMSGTGVVLSLIAFPVYLLMSMLGTASADANPIYTVAVMVLAALALWNIAVMAHILKEALEVGMFTGVMLAISYIWIILTVSAALFPTESV